MFLNCPVILSLWRDLALIIKNKTNLEIQIEPKKILFGESFNKNNIAINFIYLLTKQYIYVNLKKNKPVNTNQLINVLKLRFKAEKVIARRYFKLDYFYQIWSNWLPFIEETC